MIITLNTNIYTESKSKPILNAINSLKRDIEKILISTSKSNDIYLVEKNLSTEEFEIESTKKGIERRAKDELS